MQDEYITSHRIVNKFVNKKGVIKLRSNSKEICYSWYISTSQGYYVLFVPYAMNEVELVSLACEDVLGKDGINENNSNLGLRSSPIFVVFSLQ